MARLTPVFEKDNRQTPSNYCSISALSVLSKLYEKRTYSRLYLFLTMYEILFLKKKLDLEKTTQQFMS